MDVTIIRLAGVKVFRPCYSVIQGEWVTAQVISDFIAKLFNFSDDFVTENTGARIGPVTKVGMYI